MQRLQKTASSLAQKPGSLAVSGVFRDAVQAVLDAKSPKELNTALRPLYTLVSSQKYTVPEMVQAGVADACVHAVTLEKGETALLVLYVLCTQEHRVSVWNSRGFRAVVSAKAMEGNDSALSIMWNASDCEPLAKSIVTISGFTDAMLNILKDPKSSKSQKDSALSIIRNLTMFREAQPILLEHPTIIEDLLRTTIADNERMGTKATMAVANLVGKDEVKSGLLRTAKSNALNNIVNILDDCIGPQNMSYALYEPLISLHYLSIPKQNRDVMRRRLVPMLPRVLNKALSTSDLASLEHSIAIISQFAFDEDSVKVFRADESLVADLEMVVAQGKKVSEWSSLGHDAQGLLWTLMGGGETMSTETQVRQNQVMISYNWTHKPVAIRVHNFLTACGFRIWRDDDQMRANLMEAMAEAVLESAAIIVLVSPQYKESPNCQREATFALQKGKKIIPLLVSEGYSGDGWLGLLIAPMMYYDVTKDFDGMMRKVVEGELKSVAGKNARGGVGQVMSPSSKPRLESVDDVVAFIRAQPGLEDLADAFLEQEIDGQALSAMLKAWHIGTLRFSEVKEWFGVKSAGKLFKLKAALEQAH